MIVEDDDKIWTKQNVIPTSDTAKKLMSLLLRVRKTAHAIVIKGMKGLKLSFPRTQNNLWNLKFAH